MKKMRTVFVPSWPGYNLKQALSEALVVGSKFRSHIDVQFIRPDLVSYCETMAYGSVMPPVSYEAIMQADDAAAEQAKGEFDSWRAQAGLAVQADASAEAATASWKEREGLLAREIVRMGRLADLIVMNFPNPAVTFHPALTAALFETARPVLAVPEQGCDVFEHIVVAWDGGLAAARAVSAAMPFFKAARKVSAISLHEDKTLFTDSKCPDDGDLAQCLKRHGVDIHHHRLSAHGAAVGQALMGAAQSEGATMMVMGAYTHSRVVEALTGGVTRFMLRNSPLPILLAH